jgi:hypothetical protein
MDLVLLFWRIGLVIETEVLSASASSGRYFSLHRDSSTKLADLFKRKLILPRYVPLGLRILIGILTFIRGTKS